MGIEKIGIAIVGCGTIFTNHVETVVNNDKVELMYLVDINEEKVKSLADRYNCEFSVNIDDVLRDERVDVVHILTPHYLHCEMAKKAILASKHVILEKPAGIELEDVQELKELSIKMNKQIAVVFQNRYNPSLLKAKEILDSNMLGDIKGLRAFITWKRDKEYYGQDEWRGKWKTEGGGLLINQAIHTLDVMQWLGGEISEIKGHIDTRILNEVIEVEDTADATLKYKNGAVGLFYGSNNYVANSPIEIEIICDKGKLVLDNDTLWLRENENIQKIVADKKPNGSKSYWGNGHKIFINHVYDRLMKEEKVDIDIDIGLKALEIVQGIYNSSRNNAYYKMKYQDNICNVD